MILEHLVLAHSLKALFRGNSLNPDEAIADAIGLDPKVVKKGQFMARLERGYAASIPGTKLRLPDVVDLLREKCWIEPATEAWGAEWWQFLRGELMPDVDISELVDHHLARVGYARVKTEREFLDGLQKQLGFVKFDDALLEDLGLHAPHVHFKLFLRSPVRLTDKLLIGGLLYVEAYLRGEVQAVKSLHRELFDFRYSGFCDLAFGPYTADVWHEVRQRLFYGQLPYAYGQRHFPIFEFLAPSRILLPNEHFGSQFTVFNYSLLTRGLFEW